MRGWGCLGVRSTPKHPQSPPNCVTPINEPFQYLELLEKEEACLLLTLTMIYPKNI